MQISRKKGIKNRVDRNHKGIKAGMSASWWHEMPSLSLLFNPPLEKHP